MSGITQANFTEAVERFARDTEVRPPKVVVKPYLAGEGIDNDKRRKAFTEQIQKTLCHLVIDATGRQYRISFIEFEEQP